MRLEPLYRARFATTQSWSVDVEGAHGVEGQSFLLVEGGCEGRLRAVLRAANFPRRRTDGVFTPDFRGVLETGDGAVILFEWWGYGTTTANGERRLAGTITHLTDDERYRWLNEVVGVLGGKVAARDGGGLDVELDVSELIWEPF